MPAPIRPRHSTDSHGIGCGPEGAGLGARTVGSEPVPNPRMLRLPVGIARDGVISNSVCAFAPYIVVNGNPARQRANASWNSAAD